MNLLFKSKVLVTWLLLLFSCHALALSERHLIIVCHGDKPSTLLEKTNKEKKQTDETMAYAKQISNLLLTYGFDNRSIAAVFVPPDKKTRKLAEEIAEIGLFAKDKIHIDKRLSDKQTKSFFKKKPENTSLLTDAAIREKVLAVYDEVETKYQKGHVLFLAPGVPAMELIDGVIHSKVKLRTAQAYMLPLVKREIT